MKKMICVMILIWNLSSFALIGGSEVLDSEVLSKSIVALQLVETQGDGKTKYYKATGVLIAPNLILTAAHHVFDLDEINLSEAIFSITPHWGAESKGQTRIRFHHVEILPGFGQDAWGTYNDLALIYLESSAPVESLPLPIEMRGQNAPRENERALVLGYGRSQELAEVDSSDYRLRKIELTFSRWGTNSVFDSSMLWLSNQKGSITGGDTGGPVLFERTPGKYVVYGIASHLRFDMCVVDKTCDSESGFSNLSYFSSWISKMINKYY